MSKALRVFAPLMLLFIAAIERDCYSYGMGAWRDFLKLLSALAFLCAAPSLIEAKLICAESLKGDPDLFVYTHESNMDRVIRGEWPWSDRDGAPQMIARARDSIVSKRKLTQEQNVRLWEAYADRISYHVRGYMKNHKVRLRDGSILFYSDPLDTQSAKPFYRFFVFPPDGSMHYGRRSTDQIPTEPRFMWRNGNESLSQLK